MNDYEFDAETAIIGALLIVPEESADAVSTLVPEDFCMPHARKAFTAIAEALKQQMPIDAAIFSSTTADDGLRQYVLTAAQGFISAANLSGYVQIVKDRARQRRLLDGISGLMYARLPPDDIIAELSGLVEREQATNAPYQDQITARFLQYGNDLYKPFDPATRIYTGFSRLDGVLGGLRKGSISYIGAMPSTGKTALALNILLRALKDGRRAQFFSLEMSVEQLLDRLFASSLRYDIRRIDHKELTEDEQNRIMQALARIYEKKNLWIIDDEYTVEGMAGKIAAFKPELVVVDFMQNIRTAHRAQNRKGEIDYISAEFKRIARRHGAHILVLSQINRMGEAGAPRMADLKESGNLEADGDYVLLLHRPYVQDKTEKYKPSETSLLIDKNKYGGCGKVTFSFDGRFQRFTEVENRYEQPA